MKAGYIRGSCLCPTTLSAVGEAAIGLIDAQFFKQRMDSRNVAQYATQKRVGVQRSCKFRACQSNVLQVQPTGVHSASCTAHARTGGVRSVLVGALGYVMAQRQKGGRRNSMQSGKAALCNGRALVRNVLCIPNAE